MLNDAVYFVHVVLRICILMRSVSLNSFVNKTTVDKHQLTAAPRKLFSRASAAAAGLKAESVKQYDQINDFF